MKSYEELRGQAAKLAVDLNIKQGRMCCESCHASAMTDVVRIAVERWFCRGSDWEHDRAKALVEALTEALRCSERLGGELSAHVEEQMNEALAKYRGEG